jgi:branched-chain amino acid transport system substrate-binding protein
MACGALALLVLAACSPKSDKAEPGASPGGGRPQALAQGVTADTITIGFAFQQQACGFDLSAVLNNFNLDPQKAIDAYVEYFNKTADMNGRKLKAVITDDGGFFCPDKSRAAGVKLVKDDKVFAVVSDGGAQHATIDAVTNENVFHIGGGVLVEPDTYYQSHAPYAWSPFMTGTRLSNVFASYIGNKAKVPGAVYGLFHLDDTASGQMAAELTKKLGTYGIQIAKTVRLAVDPGTAIYQVTNAVAQFKAAGVTHLILYSDPLSPALITSQATLQDWHPKYLVSSQGYLDTFEVAVNYDKASWQDVRGISILIPRDKSYESFEFFKAFQQYGKGQAPIDAPLWFFRFQVLVEGIKRAGPDLTRDNFVKGMRSLDIPSVANGPRFKFGQDNYGGITDAAEIKWDPDKQNYTFPEGFVRHQTWDP